ncbi:unnamed protein product [Linum trigynum]|uniref:Uncharacterized protein n=1 Tax=Linum trigynum TaxID=586398 RepID=A0AAV2FH32_9ROSI
MSCKPGDDHSGSLSSDNLRSSVRVVENALIPLKPNQPQSSMENAKRKPVVDVARFCSRSAVDDCRYVAFERSKLNSPSSDHVPNILNEVTFNKKMR